MSKYQAYSEYKDSGVEWLEELPSNWDVKRVKAMLNLERHLVGKKSNDYQLLSLTLRGVIPRDISDGGGKIPAEFDTYQIVERNNLIFCLFDIDETPRTIGIAKQRGMITGAYNVYSALEPCVPEYAYYYFMHLDSFKGLRPFYTGLRKVVRSDTFSNIKIPAPSKFEQEKIANFLDHETAKIDTLIDKQQQLIRLLKEKRQAVISHAVTKGLNPNAPMRDSGVEWLGEVPEHWEMTRAKFVSNIFIPQRNKPELNDAEGTAWVTMENMKTSYIENTSLYVSRNASKVAGSKKLKKDSVIASCVGNFGVAAINKVDVIINQQLQAFIPFAIKAEYLRELVAISTVYFELVGTAATLTYVNQEGFENLPVLVPPANEQKKICIYLEAENMKFENLIDKAQSAIQLMQERRTALISAAVTGKIDVSHWQVPAPMQSKEAV